MAKYLNERQVGFDPSHVGFPNLGDCMALVMVDTGGMYGFHLTRGDLTNAPKFIKFVVDHISYSGSLQHMYAACHRKRRYGQTNGLSNWKDEMTKIANAITYTGGVSGFDLSKSGIGNKSNDNEAIYAELRLAAGTCSIWYKGMNKMTEGQGASVAPDDHIRALVSDQEKKRQLFAEGRGNEWDIYNPIRKISPNLDHAHTTSMTLTTATRGNKGDLHKASKLDTFQV